MQFLSSILWAVAVVPLLAGTAALAETTLYVGNVAPYAYLDSAPRRGLIYELIRETALRAGHSGTIKVVPLRRQLQMLLHQPDTLGSVTRLPERETQFSWPVKLLQEPVTLVTLANSPVDISNVHAASQLRIGVMLGGPAEVVARRTGFARVEATTNNRNNINKLIAGRLDAIIVLGGMFAASEALPDPSVALREGAVLGRVDIYLAGAAGLPPAEAHRWQQAFQTLRNDGGYTRLLRKYHHPDE